MNRETHLENVDPIPSWPHRLAEIEAAWPFVSSPPNLPVTMKAVAVIHELIAAVKQAWRERDGGLVGTSNCPICGKSTPHHHSAEPAERGDLLPTIKHALNELQMSGESTRLASNEIYPYAIGWLWYLVKRADRAEAELAKWRTLEVVSEYQWLQTVREAVEAIDWDDIIFAMGGSITNTFVAKIKNLQFALSAAQDPAR